MYQIIWKWRGLTTFRCMLSTTSGSTHMQLQKSEPIDHHNQSLAENLRFVQHRFTLRDNQEFLGLYSRQTRFQLDRRKRENVIREKISCVNQHRVRPQPSLICQLQYIFVIVLEQSCSDSLLTFIGCSEIKFLRYFDQRACNLAERRKELGV